MSGQCYGVRVGLLELWFDEIDKAYNLIYPPWHSNFTIGRNETEVINASVFSDSLKLSFFQKKLRQMRNGRGLYAEMKSGNFGRIFKATIFFLIPCRIFVAKSLSIPNIQRVMYLVISNKHRKVIIPFRKI